MYHDLHRPFKIYSTPAAAFCKEELEEPPKAKKLAQTDKRKE